MAYCGNTITLPKSYTNSNYHISITDYANAPTGVESISMASTTKTITTFSVISSKSGSGSSFDFIAIGY